MNLTRNQVIIIFIAVAIILSIILMFVFFGQDEDAGRKQEVELVIWGVEDIRNFKPSLDSYMQIRPEVKITYKQIPRDSYERYLINALAAGQGPDILMFHNTWLPKHFDKITPANESQIPFANFRKIFPTVVKQDMSFNNAIYSLPLYIDTLAFIYNKDAFDSRAIAMPPTRWQEFKNLIPILSAAIGGSERSINQANDLLSLLMLQFNAPMINHQHSRADFDEQGLKALNFYLQFANPASPFYTWNENRQYSINAFGQGEIDVIFNYAKSIPQIKAKNPFLNLAIAPMLQFDLNNPINYANYWGLAVSNQSQNPAWAWDFILFITVNPVGSLEYLQNSGHSPALRTLIAQHLNDPHLGVFARQALTARSWFQPDSAAINQIFSNMIQSVLNGRLSPSRALEWAENEITSLMR